MKKFRYYTVLIAISFVFGVTQVLALSVGVKPKEFNLEAKIWRTTEAEMLVFNTGKEPSLYQVFPDGLESEIKIIPSDFRLEANGSQVIKIIIKPKTTGKLFTNISVVAHPLAADGLAAASGIKVPVSLAVSGINFWYLVLIVVLLACLTLIISVKLRGKDNQLLNNNMKTAAKIIIVLAVFFVGLYVGQRYIDEPIFSFNQNQQEEVNQSQKETVSLMIDFGNGQVKAFDNIEFQPGQTVFNVLKATLEKNNINLQYKDYGGDLGVFIESIGGVKNSVSSNRFWQLWVDNKYSKVGASSFELADGNAIEFKYIKGQMN